jgi:hypothetical protein
MMDSTSINMALSDPIQLPSIEATHIGHVAAQLGASGNQ